MEVDIFSTNGADKKEVFSLFLYFPVINGTKRYFSRVWGDLRRYQESFLALHGNSIRYEYAADGTKLRTVHKTGATTLTTDYCGNAVYENGVLRMLLNEAGYVSFPDRKFHFYLKDHQGNTRVVADKDGNVEETNNYYPFGGTFTSTASVQPYKYNGKELDQKNGLNWYDYGARHYDATIGRWHVVDPMSEKYYRITPYVHVANNPLKYIDLKGDSISVADLYARNKQGELINPNQVEAFEFLVSTKEGKALLANYAAKGQEIAGATFDKNGVFHTKGVNILFGTKVSKSISSGSTSFSVDEKFLNIKIGVSNSSDIGDLLDTFIHEIAIHADQSATDYIDDKMMNNSNAYPALRKMNASRGYTQHWQERNVNRAMEKIGVPIMRQYYKLKGMVKSNDTILKMVYGFLN
ncbi:RHS repeat domain-containing protein [Bacteroides bouchesdurhonensis]|uniref:RHS repeat domain-containing protein n=1 Tax=Bacteroides bouchesdurhonensis TaxID=1841855 RepID=UPI00291C5225|nr:RHS repeat-associated core domain-containing protein [Bacteroides bouchesdurhonensis]